VYCCVCAWICVCKCVHVSVWGDMYIMCTYVFVYQRVGLHVTAIRTHSRDPDPIRICVRCGADTLAIQRPTHRMIRRSVPVRAMKTRRRFGSKTASFHMSICSYIIFLFIIVSSIYMWLVSFHVTD